MRRYLETLKEVAFVTFKEWSAYRSHMLISLFVGPAFFTVQYFIWNAVFAGTDSIRGLSLQQMIGYYGITAVIGYFTYDSADWNLQMLVRTGQFMTFLLRPMNHRSYALAQKIGHRALAFVIEFIPICLIFSLIFKVPLVPHNFFWAIASLLLGFMMNFLINYSVGISGFWLVKAEGIRQMFQIVKDVFAGVYLPLALFPDVMQKILFFLPFQFIAYVPSRVFIGSYKLAGIELSLPAIVGIQAFAVLAMLGISELLFRAALRRFTGVGA